MSIAPVIDAATKANRRRRGVICGTSSAPERRCTRFELSIAGKARPDQVKSFAIRSNRHILRISCICPGESSVNRAPRQFVSGSLFAEQALPASHSPARRRLKEERKNCPPSEQPQERDDVRLVLRREDEGV